LLDWHDGQGMTFPS